MHKMSKHLAALALSLAGGLAWAQAGTPGLTDGEVRKVDVQAGRITIRHAEIRHLDMPAMTMVFRAPDAALLQQVKPGDRIRFRAEKVEGGYAVTAVEPAAN
ncbi:copper-binding protein [Aquincola sp. J276]|uniref:copper-binding protein n=1 Tax=Aquincola sp. J276 TaxID=2898432 RepID=UPI002150D052|nr:copper-binding protein [Aquincola sp. J276]MCR5869161.1 copper-binding protein [Aquincola sp. J276]